MSRKTIAEYRALLKQEEKKTTTFTHSKDIYPFWNMPVGAVAKVRILPDANDDNPRSWYEFKFNHDLIIKGKKRKVQCLHQYGEKCPICELSAAFYKSDKAEGKKDSKDGKFFYRKKSALLNILVLEDPLPPDAETGETYKGKVVRTIFANQLYNKVISSIREEDIDPLEHNPWDLENGYDFYIKKSLSGGFSAYDVDSKFSTRSTPIPAEYRDRIELVNLFTLLPPNPGLDKIQALLDSHLHGSDIEDEAGLDKQGDEENHSTTTTLPTQQAKKAESAPVRQAAETSESQASEPVLSESQLYANIKDRFKKKPAQ